MFKPTERSFCKDIKALSQFMLPRLKCVFKVGQMLRSRSQGTNWYQQKGTRNTRVLHV